MNILWLTNIPLPEASLLMNKNPSPFGGWLVNSSLHLADEKEVKLSIAFPENGISNVHILEGEKIKYYGFPSIDIKDDKLIKNNIYLKIILNQVKPDIIHIFGTEYPHTLAMVNICQDEEVVISIQGLISIYAKHYLTGIPYYIQNRYTIRDFLKQDNLRKQQRKFIKRGKCEIQALRRVKHVIGRTTWDKACISEINPDIQYHFCNEILRDEFYNHRWDIKSCERYSIFVSQGSYPIKGLHFMLEAMPIILENYPTTRLYVGGQNIVKSNTLKDKLKISSYGRYIKKLIQKYSLEKCITFTGLLDEKQMCERYLHSHVFVCPSSIENSPNSLGEAMILGVPCVASDVGGVSDMLKHKEDGFVYQADAPYMLAYYVCEIFKNDQLAVSISKKAREHAVRTYDIDKNTKQLMKIYKQIIE